MDNKEKYLQDFRRIQREKAYAREQQAGIDALAMQNGTYQPKQSEPTAVEVKNDTIGNGFFGHMKDAADVGFFGSLAGTARFAGEFSPFGGEWLNSVADDLDERVRQNTPLDALTGSDYFAAAVGNALGSGAAGMLEGAVLLGAGSALGAAFVPAGTAVGIYKTMRSVPVVGKLVKATHKMWKSNFGKMQIAEIAGSPIEATAEAGNLITEMRNEGYSDEEIRSAALQSAKYNTGWLTVANMVGGKINNAIGSEGIKAGFKGAAKAAIKGAATEGLGESVQEYGQSYAHDAVKGVEFNQEEAEEAALQALIGSAFLGGVGNVAKPYINQTSTKKKDEKAQEATTSEASNEENPEQPQAEVPAAVQDARNVIIDYRETLDEDDPEYDRLTELLKNGNNEEIIDEANGINGIKPQAVEEPVVEEHPQQEETVEQESVQESVATPIVETEVIEPDAEEDVEEVETSDVVGETTASPAAINQGVTQNLVDVLKRRMLDEYHKEGPFMDAMELDKARRERLVAEAQKDLKAKAEKEAYLSQGTFVDPIELDREKNKRLAAEARRLKQLSGVKKEYHNNPFVPDKAYDGFIDLVYEALKGNQTAVDALADANVPLDFIDDVVKNLDVNKLAVQEHTPKENKFDAKINSLVKKYKEGKISFGVAKEDFGKFLRENKVGISDGMPLKYRLERLIKEAYQTKKEQKADKVVVEKAKEPTPQKVNEAIKQQKITEEPTNYEVREDGMPPSLDDTMEGLLTEKPVVKKPVAKKVEVEKETPKATQTQKAESEKPKTKIQKAQDNLKEIKNQERNEYGYKTKLGDYTLNPSAERSEKYHGYSHNSGKDYKAIHKNDDDTYMIETMVKDENGDEISTYETFESLEEAENFIATGKRSKPTKLKTYWASVRDSNKKIKILKMAYTSKEKFKDDIKGNGYRVRFIATPDKFEAETEAFDNKTEAWKKTKQLRRETINKSLSPNLVVVESISGTPHHKLTPEQRKERIKIWSTLLEMLRNAGVKLYTTPEKLAYAAQNSKRNAVDGEVVLENSRVYIVTKEGKRFELNGLADSKTDTIYLNSLNPYVDIPIHEYTHLWTKILKKTKPSLWAKGVKLLKQTPMWEEIKNHEGYRLKGDDAIADEVFAWLVGENGAGIIEKLQTQQGKKTLGAKLKAWIKEFWNELKSFFALNGSEHVEELTLEEFIHMPLKDLVEGKPIKSIKDEAAYTAEDDSEFFNNPEWSHLPKAQRKLMVFLKHANRTTKKIFENIKVFNRTVEIAEKEPELLSWTNPKNNEHYYYARYKDGKKDDKVVTKSLTASEFEALKYITRKEVEPYKVVSENVKEGMTPQEAIKADTDIKEFLKWLIGKKKRFDGREELVESLLNLENEADGETIAEQTREAAAQDLPEAGQENEEDAFFELEFDWVDNDYIEEIAYDYYKYLIEKYETKLASQSFMLVPASKNQAQNKRVKELEKRLEAGENRLAIFEETGWYKAKDGRWKYFIDDDLDAIDLSKVSNEDGKLQVGSESILGELYDNPKLFKKFPYLKDIKVFIIPAEENSKVEGYFDFKKNEIYLMDFVNNQNAKENLLHEAEHAIQHHEGMATGSDTRVQNIEKAFGDTVQRISDLATLVSDTVGEYVYDYMALDRLTNKLFGERGADFAIEVAKENLKLSKGEYEAKATTKQKAKAEEYIKLYKSIRKNLYVDHNQALRLEQARYKTGTEKAKQTNYYAYWDTLGEEEARLVAMLARKDFDNLSQKDKNLREDLLYAIRKAPKTIAKNATEFLWRYSKAGDGKNLSFRDAEGELVDNNKGDEIVNTFNTADDKVALANSLAYLHFVMGNDDLSIVLFGEINSPTVSLHLEKVDNANSVESRLRNAVTTVKPTSVKEDIDKAGGKKSWLGKQWRKFYRAWVDKNVDIKDFDEILSNALGRALTAGESIYNKVQMATSKAAGVAHGLIEGDEKHLKAINGEMKRKPMKHIKATLANVLDIVNAEKMDKIAPDYLSKFGEGYTWVEAFGTYLGWRRLAEMARLKREAYNQELAEWTARKAAYNAWVDSGKIGDNPQVAAYKEWEAYQKAKKNAKRRWERLGKIGPDPSEEIKAKWLETHKDEEAPKKYVGKEPEFEEYKMPEGLTEKDVLKAIKEAPVPFAEAANLYYKLNDNILSIMEDAGLISAELHELLNTKYKEYCPMIRDFSDTAAVDTFVESITAGGKGVANVSSMLKKIRAEGSERTIINPLESTLQTIAAVTNRAERNKAGQHLVRMMVSAPELKGQIRKLEQPKHGTINADPKNCIFTIMFNGKKVAYQSDPNYYQAIVGYNMLTSSLLLRIPQTVARTLRTGATMSPSFIVRNIFRDTITAGIASKNGFIPIVDTIRGAKALWSDPDFRAKFEAAGIVNFNQYGSAESAYRNLTALGSGKNYTVYEPKEIIKGVLEAVFKGKGMEALKTTGISFEQLSSFAESATRAGEFKKAMDAGKSMSEAAYDAREVTIDFSRAGIVGQEFNRVIPFFNACIQGGDKMVRLLYEDFAGTAMKIGAYIMLPSLALWLLNHDEDWYEELDPSVKYTHWCLPNGVRVPKPQEYGILFGSSIEAALDQAVINDPRAMKEWASAMKDVVTPSILPTIMLPLIEWQTNYSFFKGRDLVPQRLQRLPDELQYSTGTSEASKFIGKHTYTSPVKIDNLVRGYTGTMGMFLWQTPDWFAAEKQNLPAKKLSEMQFVRDFNVTDVVRNRYVNDFYELQQKANQYQAGYGTKGKPSNAVKMIRKAGKVINDLNKDIRAIEMSDKYTSERKRELIDKKRERINNTAKIVVKKYGNDFL